MISYAKLELIAEAGLSPSLEQLEKMAKILGELMLSATCVARISGCFEQLIRNQKRHQSCWALCFDLLNAGEDFGPTSGGSVNLTETTGDGVGRPA